MDQNPGKNRTVEYLQSHRVLMFCIFWGLIVLIPLVAVSIRKSNGTYSNSPAITSQDNDSYDCLDHKFTLQELRSIAASENIDVSQSDLDKINSKPLCRVVCTQQIEYSKKYTDWYANSDLRKICAEIGIVLPPNR